MRGARPETTLRSRQLRKDQTPAEAQLWAKLRARRLCGYKFVRQEPVGPYYADFLCREHALVIEIDGATHSSAEERAHDDRRNLYLRANGFRVLRVTNEDVFVNTHGVCETILAAVERRSTL